MGRKPPALSAERDVVPGQVPGVSEDFQRRILNEKWNERRFTHWMNADAIKEFEQRLGPASNRTFQAGVHHVEHILRIEELTR